MSFPDRIFQILKYYWHEMDHQLIEDVVVFGSAADSRATPFLPASSDVDACLLFSDACQTPTLRLEAMSHFVPIKRMVEEALRREFRRPDASRRILSISAVSEAEHSLDIFKTDCPVFFSPESGNQFFSIQAMAPRVFEPRLSGSLLPNLSARNLIAAITRVQMARHQYMDVNSNDERPMTDFADLVDPLPKMLVRFACVVARNGKRPHPAPQGEMFDVNFGLQVMQRWVEESAATDSSYDAVARLVAQRVGRGTVSLTTSDQLLLWEILFDRATESLLEHLDPQNNGSDSVGRGPIDTRCRISVAQSAVTAESQVYSTDSESCGICGCSLSGERALVFPFKLLDGRGRSDIYSCSKCFSQAKSEGWGRNTLLAYQGMKENECLESPLKTHELFTFKLDVTVSPTDEAARQLILREVVKSFDCSPGSIDIVAMDPGSTIITLMLPAELAQALKSESELSATALPQAIARINRLLQSRETMREEITLGQSLSEQGDIDRAVQCFVSAERVSELIDDKETRANLQCNLGLLRERQGSIDDAVAHHELALVLDTELGNVLGVANHKFNLGRLLKQLGRTERAHQLLIDAQDLFRSLGEEESARSVDFYLK